MKFERGDKMMIKTNAVEIVKEINRVNRYNFKFSLKSSDGTLLSELQGKIMNVGYVGGDYINFIKKTGDEWSLPYEAVLYDFQREQMLEIENSL